jgi:hypothetical protein
VNGHSLNENVSLGPAKADLLALAKFFNLKWFHQPKKAAAP